MKWLRLLPNSSPHNTTTLETIIVILYSSVIFWCSAIKDIVWGHSRMAAQKQQVEESFEHSEGCFSITLVNIKGEHTFVNGYLILSTVYKKLNCLSHPHRICHIWATVIPRACLFLICSDRTSHRYKYMKIWLLINYL